MQIELSGLTFRAVSPSHFELLSVRDDIGSGAKVYVRFNGEHWVTECVMPNGHAVSKAFRSREAAVDIITGRIG